MDATHEILIRLEKRFDEETKEIKKRLDKLSTEHGSLSSVVNEMNGRQQIIEKVVYGMGAVIFGIAVKIIIFPG